MEYTIIEGGDKDTVAKAVNEHLKEGWELSGNLVVTIVEASHHQFLYRFFQAMTKKGDNKFFGG